MYFRNRATLSALAIACAPVVASAEVLFSDNFDAGTSATRYEAPQIVDIAGGGDAKATFNFNYGNYNYFYTDTGGNVNASRPIPQAPRSLDPNGPRIGLRVDANNTSDTASPNHAAINLYPKLTEYSAVPSGDHKLTFDVWMNYTGIYEGNAGSMEFFSAGINTAGGAITGIHPGIGNPPPGAPNSPGYSIAVNGERTNTLDFRFYRDNLRLGSLDASTGYVAQDEGTGNPGPADGRNAFYQDLFPFENPDPSIDEAWYETPGSIGKHWTTVEVKMEDDIFYLYMKPAGASEYTLIGARTDRSLSSGQIMLGYADVVSGTAALETRSPSGPDVQGLNPQDANFGIFDNVVVETITQVRPTWSNPSGGNWSAGSNWAGGNVANNDLPNFIHEVADFTNAISAPQTVTVDAPHSVRSIAFDNNNSYTIAGANTITIDGITSGIRGTLRGVSGSHTISAPLQLNKDTDAIISTGARLNLSGDTTAAAGLGITKSGGGTLEMKHVRMDRLQIDGGSVEVTPNGGAEGTSIVKSLTVSPGGAFRLNDNDLIVDYADDATTSPEVAIRDLVKAGRVDQSTTGIFSTPGATRDNVLLAVVDNSDWGQTTYNGIPVDTSTVIGKYTYFGDANLDGKVTGDDYVAVDSNLGTGDSWIEGDFNMDGRVSGDDYVAIDSNLGSGTPDPLAFAELKAEMIAVHVDMFGESYLTALAAFEAEMSAVPEPGALSLIGLGTLGLLSRRRRR